MYKISKVISFIFHPLLMPLIGVLFFFSKSPRYIPRPIMHAKVYAITLLTIVVPILVFYLLKNRGIIHSIYLRNVKERLLPLMIHCVLIYLIMMRVVPPNELIELYFFFLGILTASMSCLLLVIVKYKASIHMVAIGGILMFFIAIGIHYQININGSLALVFLIAGAVASARWTLRAHELHELVVGFAIGVLPQLIFLNYWL